MPLEFDRLLGERLACLLLLSVAGCSGTQGQQSAAPEDLVVHGMLAAAAATCTELPPRDDAWKQWMKGSHRLCTSHYASNCTNLGWTLKTGDDGFTDHSAALKLLECACSLGSDEGCNALGTMFDHGHGTPIDEPRAAALYDAACEHGYVTACTNLGVLYELGSVGGAPDYPRAASLFTKACEAGEQEACTGLAYLYDTGRGVEKDRKRALDLYEAGCKKGVETACSNLGVAYEQGDGRPKDYARALELYEKACSRSNPGGCSNYALMYLHGRGVQKNPQRAAEILELGCSAWVTRDRAQACGLLAEVVLEHKLERLTADRVESYLLDACRAGRTKSCLVFAQQCLRSDPPRIEEAKALLEAACKQGSENACAAGEELLKLD